MGPTFADSARIDALLLDQERLPSLEELALAAVGGENPDGAVDELLAGNVSIEQRQARAAMLIHALNRNPEMFEGRGLKIRRKAVRLIEESFTDHQVKAWGLQLKGEDFERLDALAALPDAAVRQIETAAQQLVSLGSLEAARGEVQRAFGTFRPLLVPMVPSQLAKGKLTDLLSSVADVRGTEGPAFLAAHARACEAVADFRRDVEDAGPVAARCFTELLSRLDLLLQSAFHESPATEPADLDVRAAAKKYALSSAETPLRLGLLVTNRGPGQALDVRLDELDASGLRLDTLSVPLGTVMPNESVAGSISGASVGDESALVVGRVVWTNSNGSQQSAPVEVLFESQRGDIPWDNLRQRYDLEPVRTKQELVGRAELLRELVDLVGDRRVGNAFITGQKRVGKTSIALTFQSHFEEDDDIVVVYLEAGAYINPSAEKTIAAMGTAIALELTAADERFGDIKVPEFDATLAALRGMVGQMRLRVPKLRVVVVLDEFDELPVALYRRGDLGDAFFVALRTLASQEHIGFVLVGGEKMGPIIDAQGDQLNKFEPVPVTYLDRQRHWDDFSDLVRQPVADCFEVTDEAVVALFNYTAGHPYFTKLVCRALFKLAVRRRDAHITAPEIDQATTDALQSASVTNFIHFWEDGVLEAAEKVEDVSVRRRKALLAYAECRERAASDIDEVVAQAKTFGLSEQEARETFREFERRGVMEVVEGAAKAKVRLFDVWLARYGVNAITTTFTDPDAILNAKRREQEQRVSPEEISDLVAQWGHYRGKEITSDQVRLWLNQFQGVREQRLMFEVLRSVEFYDAGRIRKKLNEAHGVAVRGVRQRLEPGRLKRDEFVVSYLGGPAKSGARYARLYADENGIYADQVKELGKLNEALTQEACQALLIVDDLLGSGDQACEHLKLLERQVGGLIRKRSIKVVFVVITGFDSAARKVSEAAERLDLPVDVHICDPLGDSDRCFSSTSRAFDSDADREQAREVAEAYGRRLQRKFPLGYSDTQATVVFDESCPNGTLPILWDTTGEWRALFPRHKGR